MSTTDTVAVTVSPSTNHTIDIAVIPQATSQPLVGHLVAVEQEITTNQAPAREIALGTITEVTTRNRQLEQGPIAEVAIRGDYGAVFGDTNDSRSARIRLQACYRQTPEGQWKPAGAGLSTSPSTGQSVTKANNELLDTLIEPSAKVHYMGHLAGPAASGSYVRAPMTIRDFSGPLGAFSFMICGQTGSGKSSCAEYLFAGMMRFADLGFIMIDPQGQWSHESGLPFSLQGWAHELGRPVQVLRIAEHISLDKDASLMTTLLGKTRFTRDILKMASETSELLLDEMEKLLRKNPSWADESSSTLLRSLLEQSATADVASRIYADQNRQERLITALDDCRNDTERFRDLLSWFHPLHNLFSDTNPAGERRRPLWTILTQVFDRSSRQGQPAPYVVLDMSTSNISWLQHLSESTADAQSAQALAVLDLDVIKAAILRRIGHSLKRAAEASFRHGCALNVAIVMDEAWRYVPPVSAAADIEIAELSREFAGYTRDFRKFGIGLGFISQTPRSVNPDIWDQALIKIIGYGLAGANLDKVAEELDDRDHLRLYKGFAPPESSYPPMYPFMFLGPVSPLAVTKAPLFVSTYTDFDEFRRDNALWIDQLAASQGMTPRTNGTPTRPHDNHRTPTVSHHRTKISHINTDRAKVATNPSTSGVDQSAYNHSRTGATFGTQSLDPLGLSEPGSDNHMGPHGRPLDPATGEEFPF